MAKRVLLLLSCVFCLQLAFAQSMSDRQVMDFVKAEQERGTDERSIAAKLFQKGISPDRIREIKRKYENEQLLSKDQGVRLHNRLELKKVLRYFP